MKRGLSLRFNESQLASDEPVVEVKWCSNCKSRKAEFDLCEDCQKSARGKSENGLTLLFDDERRLVINRNISWVQAKYVIECEGIKVVQTKNRGRLIDSEVAWHEACEKEETDGVLELEIINIKK